jgi:hypothetical protein
MDAEQTKTIELLAQGDGKVFDQLVAIHNQMTSDHQAMIVRLNAKEIKPKDAADHINQSLLSMLNKMASIVGKDLVEEVFGIPIDQPFQLVDPELMEEAENEQ